MDYYDVLLAKKLGGGGGSSVEVESLSVTANGTYTAEEGKAYSPVTVNVNNDPVIGLLTTVEITEPIATISYELPSLAKEYGQLWEVWEDVTYSEDYLYAGVIPSGGMLNDSYGYKQKATSYTGVTQQIYQFASTFEGTSLNGFCACIGIGNKVYVANTYGSDKTYYFRAKFYNSASRFTGGRIKIYGRVQ